MQQASKIEGNGLETNPRSSTEAETSSNIIHIESTNLNPSRNNFNSNSNVSTRVEIISEEQVNEERPSAFAEGTENESIDQFDKASSINST